MNRKLQMKLRDVTAKYEDETHRRSRRAGTSQPSPSRDFAASPPPAAAAAASPPPPTKASTFVDNMAKGRTVGFLPPSVGKAGVGVARTVTEGIRQITAARETQRANEAEAALDVALSENRKLASVLHAINGAIKSNTGHSVEELFGFQI